MNLRTRSGRGSGFTLLELIIALTISAILLAVAAPSFRTTILNSRRTAVLNEVLGAMQFARSEALKQNRATQLCPTADATANPAVCSATGSDWAKGWISFVEGPGTCSATRPDTSTGCGDITLKVSGNNYEGLTITPTVTNLRFLTFNGTISGNRTLTVCDSRGAAEARAIVLDPVGRARISVTDGAGAALTCP